MQHSFDLINFWKRKPPSRNILLGILLVLMIGCSAEQSENEIALLDITAVEVSDLELKQKYRVSSIYSGRVESTRESQTGFERPGEIYSILVNQGDILTKGQIIAELDSRRLKSEYQRIQANLTRAKAELEIAKLTYDRYQAVRSSEAVSEQLLDQSRQSMAANRAAVRGAEALVSTLELDLQKTRLIAPYDARVIKRLHDEGEIISAGSPIVSLQELDSLEARIGISQEASTALAVGESYPLVFRGKTIHAELKAIISSRDLSTRTLEARFVINLDNTPLDQIPLPGDIVRLEAIQLLEDPGFWVPLGALREADRGLWSLLIAEPTQSGRSGVTHKLSPRVVDVIHFSDDQVYIRGAVKDGEQFVSKGLQRVVANQEVRISKP